MRFARHLTVAAALAALLQTGATAQILRFETNVGSFDMELNPTGNAALQPIVDNLVSYIGLGRYSYTAINRAAKNQNGSNFVLQMGGFLGFPPTEQDFLSLVQSVDRLDPVVADEDGDGNDDFASLSNTRGTVAFALSGQPANPNSGTSEFFINLTDNSFLDPQFVPFARVSDLTTVEKIMDLEIVDLNGAAGSAFDDVPLQDNGRLVILERVRVLQASPSFSFVGPIQAALDQINSASSSSSAVAAAAASIASESAASAIPEPASGVLLAMGLLGAAHARRRRA